MAGGPNAAIMSMHCLGPAQRIDEGIEDDRGAGDGEAIPGLEAPWRNQDDATLALS